MSIPHNIVIFEIQLQRISYYRRIINNVYVSTCTVTYRMAFITAAARVTACNALANAADWFATSVGDFNADASVPSLFYWPDTFKFIREFE